MQEAFWEDRYRKYDLKSCNRCEGDRQLRSDDNHYYWSCLACGKETPVAAKRDRILAPAA